MSTIPGQTAAMRVPSARSAARRRAATARTAATWATLEGTLIQRGQPCSSAVPSWMAVRQDSTAASTSSSVAPSNSGCRRGSRWPSVPSELATTMSRPPGLSTGPKERRTAWVPPLATSMNSSACSGCGRSGVSAAIALEITMSIPPWRSASSVASPATAQASATSRTRPITRLRVPARVLTAAAASATRRAWRPVSRTRSSGFMRAARPAARANPSPWLAPVTRAMRASDMTTRLGMPGSCV